jgi:hypothetical protein
MGDLEQCRATYILDTAPAGIYRWNRYPLRDYPRLDRYVAVGYERIDEVSRSASTGGAAARRAETMAPRGLRQGSGPASRGSASSSPQTPFCTQARYTPYLYALTWYWLSGWFSQPLAGPVHGASLNVQVGPGRPVSRAFPTAQFSQATRSECPSGRTGQ